MKEKQMNKKVKTNLEKVIEFILSVADKMMDNSIPVISTEPSVKQLLRIKWIDREIVTPKLTLEGPYQDCELELENIEMIHDYTPYKYLWDRRVVIQENLDEACEKAQNF